MLRSLLLLILLLPLSAQASNTAYSRLLARLQQTYLPPEAAPYPILIFDRDELEWRFTAAGATGEDAHAREEILKQYVKERTGIELHANALGNFEPYLTVLKDTAAAMPAFEGGSAPGKVQLCAVFPPDPNRNQRLEVERILQLETAEAYGTHTYEELRATLSYEDAVLFSVLHEAGHCMDQEFLPALYTGIEDVESLHKAESFAETMALLLIYREGRTDVAEPRAYLRDTYSYFMQPYFAAHGGGFGSAYYPYGGLIYHLSPSIRAISRELEARGKELLQAPLAELQMLANRTVKQQGFEGRFLTALHAVYTEGREPALDRYKKLEQDMPDFFAGYGARLQAYINGADRFRETSFTPAPAQPEATELQALDYHSACAMLSHADYDGLRDLMQNLRENLRSGAPTPKAQRARFSELSELWRQLPARCAGKSSLLLRTERVRPRASFFSCGLVPLRF